MRLKGIQELHYCRRDLKFQKNWKYLDVQRERPLKGIKILAPLKVCKGQAGPANLDIGKTESW